jgi:hypothetical protein
MSGNTNYYANVTFVFYRTTISTVIPVTDTEIDYDTVAEIANKVIREDWDIDCLDACQDYAVEVGEW